MKKIKSLAFFPSLRVVFLLVLACTSPLASAADLHELTLAETQNLLKTGKIKMTDLVDYYQQRQKLYDQQGPQLNSVVQINPKLAMLARKMDEKIASGAPLGSLFGALVLVKDNIDAVGMANTAGSWLMGEHYPRQDAFVIEQLTNQDAIIFAKTNLSEWANFRSSMSSSGWSSLYGQTRNPYDPTRSPCGSSSGSGVAVAADLALLAVGTETDGSVTCPSAMNGIVGIKPTLGLVSRSGIIPIAHSQDTAGPMARNVTDAVMLLDAMLGKDANDPASLQGDKLAGNLIKDGLKGKRIGIVRNLMGYHKQVDEIFEQQLAMLKKGGATLVDNANIETKDLFGDDEYTVLLSEFKADLNQYLLASNAPLKSLQDAIDKNIQFAEQTMPIFGQEIFIKAQQAPALSDDKYKTALANAKLNAGKLGIDATLAKYKVDILIAPTGGPAWKIDHINGDHFSGSASSPAAVSGYPHITVPMGYVQKMPVGMSFFGTYLSEPPLIQAAYAYEQLSQVRIAPKLEK
jgi:Asp-tRNA(Asn)/Glu-tRNA(Gln) amidotransferase A subunit family amidase